MQKIASYIELAAGLQGMFLLVVLLYIPSKGYAANKVLALLLLSVSSLLLWCAVHDAQLLVQWPDLMGWGPALLFTIGPLLYLYIKALIHPHFTWKKRYYLHFIPCLIAIINFFPFYAKEFEEKQRIVLQHYTNHRHSTGADLLPGLHFLLYVAPGLLGLTSFRKEARQYFSGVHPIRLRWLNRLLWGFIVAYVLFVAIYFLTDLHLAGNAFMLAQSAFIFVIGYLGLKEPVVFGVDNHIPLAAGEGVYTEAGTPGNKKLKYEKSALPDSLLDQYEEALNKLMREEKPYQDSELGLKEMADKLSLSTHHLSQVLNQRLHITFYDYINRYRLEEVKEALQNPQKDHLTILALAFEAGFKSKSVFNEAFKKYTGMTPSAYKKKERSIRS